jgi:hypothetical protein
VQLSGTMRTALRRIALGVLATVAILLAASALGDTLVAVLWLFPDQPHHRRQPRARPIPDDKETA